MCIYTNLKLDCFFSSWQKVWCKLLTSQKCVLSTLIFSDIVRIDFSIVFFCVNLTFDFQTDSTILLDFKEKYYAVQSYYKHSIALLALPSLSSEKSLRSTSIKKCWYLNLTKYLTENFIWTYYLRNEDENRLTVYSAQQSYGINVSVKFSFCHFASWVPVRCENYWDCEYGRGDEILRQIERKKYQKKVIRKHKSISWKSNWNK